MAKIINQNGKIIIQSNSGDAKLTLAKTNISHISRQPYREYLTIHMLGTVPSMIKLNHSDITFPQTDSITELEGLLNDYWTINEGPYHVFVAEAAQTEFDCSPYFSLTDEYKVFINGVFQSSGHSRSGDTVIFTSAPGEGTEVMIMI